jgi:hypothetical protein
LGDQPILGAALDPSTGRVFVGTDFGVLALSRERSRWAPAAQGMPGVAVYGITFDATTHTLFAATHGRGVWRLKMEQGD